MRISLSLVSISLGVALCSGAASAQRAASTSTCSASTCCSARAGGPAHAATVAARNQETVSASELARRLDDPARREVALTALRAHVLAVDTSDVNTLVQNATEETSRNLRAALESAHAAASCASASLDDEAVERAIADARCTVDGSCCARSTAIAAQTKAAVKRAMSQAKKELAVALDSARSARNDACAAVASANVGPAIASALEAAESSLHGAFAGPRHARVSRQDPDDPPDADDADDSDDSDDDDVDESSIVVAATPFAMPFEAAEELEHARDTLTPHAAEDADEDHDADESDGQHSKKNGDASLDERVRELERIAHGDAAGHWPPAGKDKRSLEQRVSDLERLLRERQRHESGSDHPRAATPAPKVRVGPHGRATIVTPDGQTLHVAPVPPGLAMPPMPPMPPLEPAHPGMPAPKAFHVPDGGYVYKFPKGGANSGPLERRYYSDLTPEQREKVERGLEKLEKYKVKARSEEERADRERERADRERERANSKLERAKVHGAHDGAMGGDTRREVDDLLRDMRSQMERMREEMNRMREELERLPRNDGR
jgi:hypothetical protein